MTRPRLLVLYQYLRPDDVVSARLYDDLCAGLAARGWDVEARPSNRSCHDPSVSYPLRERRDGFEIRRVWRPPFAQASSMGRVGNALWLVSAWTADLLTRRSPPDVVLVGTDPILAVTLAATVRRLRPRVRFAHWAFDLYPEAAIADDLLGANSQVARGLRSAMRTAYRSCDLIADIGPRMRERLDEYGHGARAVTLPPWGLTEPAAPAVPDPAVRVALFGEASLGLLHSGSFGRAHDPDLFLALARRLRGSGVHLCFAGRGHRLDALRARVSPADVNISFAGFCSEQELERRLGAADVHLAALRPEWSGVVVPSKFFGALAVGRPVLYAGPPDSDIGRWITEDGVGWVLQPETLDLVAGALRGLARDPSPLEALRQRCHARYHERFGRERTLERWDQELRPLTLGGGLTHPRASAGLTH